MLEKRAIKEQTGYKIEFVNVYLGKCTILQLSIRSCKKRKMGSLELYTTLMLGKLVHWGMINIYTRKGNGGI